MTQLATPAKPRHRRQAPQDTPLLWVGGKSRVLPVMLPILRRAGWFSEPYKLVEAFTGSAALSFHLIRSAEDTGILAPDRVVLRDAVQPLLRFYESLAYYPHGMQDHLGKHLCEPLTRTRFEAIRGSLNQRMQDPDCSPQEAAEFMIVNWAGYNGLWRQNLKGGCNVPWGTWTLDQDLQVMQAQVAQSAKDLRSVARDIACWDATAPQPEDRGLWGLATGTEEVLVYVDPPYPGTYSGYNKNWTEANFVTLTETLCAWAKLPRVKIAISFPATHRGLLPHGWETHPLQVPNLVGHTVASRGTRDEILVLSP